MVPTSMAGRVGPNAISQLVGPLRSALGDTEARTVFAAAGLAHAFDSPPAKMVSERDAAALFGAIRGNMPAASADEVLAAAGLRTADYVIANRIPAPLRLLLPLLPVRASARLLLKSVERHAWTFAGSGHCSTESRPNPVVFIVDNPLATPGCPWHSAVFRQLFRRLASSEAGVRHPACCARGDSICSFEILLQG